MPQPTNPNDEPQRTALVVDDETVVRTVIRRYLERRGWRILEAESAEEALFLIGSTVTTLDVVMCDLNLPGISGSAFCRHVCEMRPELLSRFVLTSGDPSSAEAEIERDALGCTMLSKPFSLIDLDRVVNGMAHAA